MEENESPRIIGKKNPMTAEPELIPSARNLDQNAAQKISDEREEIRKLEEKETNFIFLFGQKGTGKTALVGSILNHISSNPNFFVQVLRDERDPLGAKMVLEYRDAIKNKRFTDRTSVEKAFQLDILVSVKDKNGDPTTKIPLTFIDISGENLKEVSVYGEKPMGKFPPLVDKYFNANNLAMAFIMVTTPDQASQDDTIFTEFLDYISGKDEKFLRSNVCLIISKYDAHKLSTQGLTIDKFVQKRMPHSYSRLLDRKNAFSYFSVGEVITPDGDGENNLAFLRNVNEQFPLQIFQWIYETITKEKLFKLTFWERLSNFLRF